jgi:hypothetical protein
LSATPGGVTSVQGELLLDERTKSCQKVLSGSPSVPMATTATSPVEVATLALSGAPIGGGEAVVEASAPGVELEQPARPLNADRSATAAADSEMRASGWLTGG